MSTRVRLLLARLLIFLIGVFLLIWSLWYPLGQDLWDYMAISGAIYFIGALVLLVGGLYWKRASRVGAYLALACGLLAVLGLEPVKKAVGLDALEGHYSIPLDSFYAHGEPAGLSFEFSVTLTSAHVGLAALAAAMVLMVLGSIMFPDRNTKTPAPPQTQGAK